MPNDRDEYDAGRDPYEDRYDSDARRRSRRDDEPKQVSTLGILSLVQGVVSLFASFAPCIGALAIVGGALGLLLGVLGYAVAKSSGRQGTGLPIAGSVLNVVAMLIGGAWILFMAQVFQKAGNMPAVDPGDGIALTAAALDEEYDANELAADRKYKGKVLVVTGRVKRITRDDRPGKVTVELDGGPDSTVDCHFDRSQQPALAGLAVGDETAVRGTCRGKARGWVTLEGCSLDKDEQKKPEEKKAPDAAPLAVTADDLDRAYDDNVIAADAKYKGKTLELTGKVLRVARTKTGQVTVEFAAESGTPVECDFPLKDGLAQLGAVAAGDALVVRGTCRGRPDDVLTLNNCTLVKKLDKPAEGTPVAVTAEALAKAYEGNVVAADAKYKGKTLEVTGKVLRVAKNKPGKITVALGTEMRFLAECDFLVKDGQAQLADVGVGDTVVIKGVCRGSDGVPLLENCTLVKE